MSAQQQQRDLAHFFLPSQTSHLTAEQCSAHVASSIYNPSCSQSSRLAPQSRCHVQPASGILGNMVVVSVCRCFRRDAGGVQLAEATRPYAREQIDYWLPACCCSASVNWPPRLELIARLNTSADWQRPIITEERPDIRPIFINTTAVFLANKH